MEQVEKWVAIKGLEGMYEVSDFGRLRSIDRYVKSKNANVFQKGKILVPQVDNKGYLRFSLSKDNKRIRFKAHRLVASHFIDNSENKAQVNHKDGNKKNNSVSNLEWVTNRENQLHSFRELGRVNHMKGVKGINFNVKNSVVQCSLDGFILNTFNSFREAFISTQINRKYISECVKGKRESVGGYLWL